MEVYLASPCVEQWRPVAEALAAYEVSDAGRLRNAVTGRILKPWRSKRGYLLLDLCSGSSRLKRTLHRLVACAFIPNPLALPEVNHKDANKENCCVANLEWSSRLANVRHAVSLSLNASGATHGMSKLTEESVLLMRQDAAAGATLSQLSEKYGVTFGRVGAIIRGDSWKRTGGPRTNRGLDHRKRPR